MKEDAGLAAATHVLGLITGFLAPLIIYLVKTEEGLVRDQAREALNFQITVIIASIISFILMAVVVGFIILPIVIILDIIFCIKGAVSANKGEKYRYPINIRLIQHPVG